MKPDACRHNPGPAYLRGLVERSGLSQRKIAQRLGITDRMLRYYLAEEGSNGHRTAPYLVQYALEGLAAD